MVAVIPMDFIWQKFIWGIIGGVREEVRVNLREW
jgi:hypothetical protein